MDILDQKVRGGTNIFVAQENKIVVEKLEIKICPKSSTRIFEQSSIGGTVEIKKGLSERRLMTVARQYGEKLMKEHFEYLSNTQFHFLEVERKG
jgi:hypothetical protein